MLCDYWCPLWTTPAVRGCPYASAAPREPCTARHPVTLEPGKRPAFERPVISSPSMVTSKAEVQAHGFGDGLCPCQAVAIEHEVGEGDFLAVPLIAGHAAQHTVLCG